MKTIKNFKRFLAVIIAIFILVPAFSYGANTVKVKSVQLDFDTLTIQVGENRNVGASVLPSDAKSKSLRFFSSNIKVATVTSKGVLKGITEGKAVITVKSTSNSKVVSKCNIVVTKENNEPQRNIKIIVPDGVPTLSILKMMKENRYLGKNIKTSYEVIKTPDLLSSKIISKEADIAVVPTNLASNLFNKKIQIQLAGSCVWGIQYLASSENIKDWKDLKGKDIYTSGRGLTPDVTFRYLLSENGINEDKDINLKYMGSVQEIAQALLAGKIKTAILSEPVLTQVITKNPDIKVVMDLQKEWSKASGLGSSYPQASVVISNDLIEKYPKTVDIFLREFSQSAEWTNQNPSKAGDLAEELGTGMLANVMDKAVERSNIHFVYAKDAKKSIEKYLKVLYDFAPESIGGKLPDEKFYLNK